ncbi:MAG: GNAT family N-acetyltransferase [bacterium]|nr:GNAT family N-acetyltransferase [bacterium]
MNLVLKNAYAISDIQPSDRDAYVKHLQVKQIHDQTLAIPYPYTLADADIWIQRVADETARLGRSVNWAIRHPDGTVVGGIGFNELEPGVSHRAELGYWLAMPYWGQGIMTEAVKAVMAFAFDSFGLVRITAHVFAFNKGSARVLEKAGFQLEGYLRKHYQKNGVLLDGKLYASVTES